MTPISFNLQLCLWTNLPNRNFNVIDQLKHQFDVLLLKNLSSGSNFLVITCQNVYSLIKKKLTRTFPISHKFVRHWLINLLIYYCKPLGPIALPFNRKRKKLSLSGANNARKNVSVMWSVRILAKGVGKKQPALSFWKERDAIQILHRLDVDYS